MPVPMSVAQMAVSKPEAAADWSVQQLTDWVRGSGVTGAEALAEKLLSEDITGALLLSFNDRAQLKHDLGMTLGMANQLWNAIEQLKSAHSSSVGSKNRVAAGGGGREEGVPPNKATGALTRETSVGISPQIVDTFNEFDKDGSGTIDAGELQNLAYACGEVLTSQQAAALLVELDKDGNGTIDLEEFQSWLAAGAKKLESDSGSSGWLQSVRLRYSLLSQYYARKFQNLAAGEGGLNTYSVDLTVGRKENIKIHVTAQATAKTEEDLALLDETHGKLQLIVTTKEETTEEQAARLALVFDDMWKVLQLLYKQDAKHNTGLPPFCKPDGTLRVKFETTVNSQADLVLTLTPDNGLLEEIAGIPSDPAALPIDPDQMFHTVSISAGVGFTLGELMGAAFDRGPLVNRSFFDIARTGTSVSLSARLSRSFLKVSLEGFLEQIHAKKKGTPPSDEDLKTAGGAPIPMVPLFAMLLGSQDAQLSFRFTDFAEVAQLVALCPDSSGLAPLRLKLVDHLLPVLTSVYQGIKESLSEPPPEAEMKKHTQGFLTLGRLLQWNETCLNTLHGIQELLVLHPALPAFRISFKDFDVFSAFLPAPPGWNGAESEKAQHLELSTCGQKDLNKQAREEGVDPDQILDALDSDSPKETVIGLILQHRAATKSVDWEGNKALRAWIDVASQLQSRV